MPRFVFIVSLPLLTSGCALGGFPAPADLELMFNLDEPLEPIPATEEPFFAEQPLFESVPGKAGSHAATITAFDDGELLAAWYSYDGPHELDGTAIYRSRRAPGSEAWDPPIQHIDRPSADGNPVLYSEGDDVWLFQAVVAFGWSTASIEVQRSSDRGHTWSPPRAVPGPIGSNVRYPPLRTSGGTLLLPAYDDLLGRSLFFTSADGQHWTLQAAIATGEPNQAIQPSVARLEDGRLLAVMRNVGGPFLWVAASDDDGQSWSAPIDSGFSNPGSAAVLLALRNRHLVLVYNDSPTARRPLTVALSAADGRTWPHRRVLADGPLAYSYPAAIQTPDGLVHVLYTHNRERIQHAAFNASWVIHADQ